MLQVINPLMIMIVSMTLFAVLYLLDGMVQSSTICTLHNQFLILVCQMTMYAFYISKLLLTICAATETLAYMISFNATMANGVIKIRVPEWMVTYQELNPVVPEAETPIVPAERS